MAGDGGTDRRRRRRRAGHRRERVVGQPSRQPPWPPACSAGRARRRRPGRRRRAPAAQRAGRSRRRAGRSPPCCSPARPTSPAAPSSGPPCSAARSWSRTSCRRPGMGFGDVKAGAVLGAALGLLEPQIALLALVLGLAAAALVGPGQAVPVRGLRPRPGRRRPAGHGDRPVGGRRGGELVIARRLLVAVLAMAAGGGVRRRRRRHGHDDQPTRRRPRRRDGDGHGDIRARRTTDAPTHRPDDDHRTRPDDVAGGGPQSRDRRRLPRGSRGGDYELVNEPSLDQPRRAGRALVAAADGSRVLRNRGGPESSELVRARRSDRARTTRTSDASTSKPSSLSGAEPGRRHVRDGLPGDERRSRSPARATRRTGQDDRDARQRESSSRSGSRNRSCSRNRLAADSASGGRRWASGKDQSNAGPHDPVGDGRDVDGTSGGSPGPWSAHADQPCRWWCGRASTGSPCRSGVRARYALTGPADDARSAARRRLPVSRGACTHTPGPDYTPGVGPEDVGHLPSRRTAVVQMQWVRHCDGRQDVWYWQPINGTPEAPGPPIVTPQDLVPGAFDSVERQLPTPVPVIAPADRNANGFAYVQNRTFFWVEQVPGQWATVTATAAVPGLSVTVTAVPELLRGRHRRRRRRRLPGRAAGAAARTPTRPASTGAGTSTATARRRRRTARPSR